MSDITIGRGESKVLSLTVQDAEGQAYTLATGELLRFGVKKNLSDEEYLLEKEIDADDYDGE